MNLKLRFSWLRVALMASTVAIAAIAGTASAEARTFVGIHVGVPLYAGPPAYYYPPYYYYPAPVYYAPRPVYYVPAPVAPNCSSGRWRQADGSIVNGVACLQPDGSWRLAY